MSDRRVLARLFAVAVSALALAGCAHHMRVMRDGNLLVVSGRSTADDSQAVASQKMLRLAARLTLDHGFRYFAIENAGVRDGLPTLAPGANITIRVYRPGEIDPRRAGIWDATQVVAGGG